jgi:hypothetical protein
LDRLRKDVAVQYVLDNMTPLEIVHVLREALARPVQDVSEIVPRYIYLAALSTVDPRDKELWEQILSLDLSHLEWGEAMRRIIRAEAVPTTTLEFSLASLPIRP